QRQDVKQAAELGAARGNVETILAELQAVDDMVRATYALRLLSSEPSVQTDLKLTDAQIEQCRTLSTQFGRPPTTSGGGEPETAELRRQELTRHVEQISAALEGVLSPEQAVRLRQILRQVRGVLALNDADVADALALSPVQKQLIADV